MGTRNGFEAKQNVVQLATYDYMNPITVEDYFERCKRYKLLTPVARASIEKMKQIKEGKINDQNTEREMKECMQRTFNLRKYDIFDKALSIKNAVDIFPGLKSFAELRREFQRVTRKSVDAFERHLNCVLKEYARDQVKQKCYMCSNKFCLEALDIIREDDNREARKTAARIMIYACAQSQRKWSDVIYIVYEKPPNGWINTKRPHPTVVVHENPFNENCAHLFCEDTRILTDVNFYEAILGCYFMYYIFNIDYPSVDAETFLPFDNVMNLMECTTKDGE